MRTSGTAQALHSTSAQRETLRLAAICNGRGPKVFSLRGAFSLARFSDFSPRSMYPGCRYFLSDTRTSCLHFLPGSSSATTQKLASAPQKLRGIAQHLALLVGESLQTRIRACLNFNNVGATIQTVGT